MLETGNGTSGLANGDTYKGTKVYNMYGVGAADGCSSPYKCGLKHAYDQGWTTPEKAIIGGAKFIANSYINRGQDTLYKIKWNPEAIETNGQASHQYATDIGWAVKQTENIKNYYDLLNNYTLVFDVPEYK
jgi:beta-N-acetylglucosaminidase